MLDHLELAGYENSLKTYRDLKDVIDTAREEGRQEGKLEGRQEGKIQGMIEGEKQATLNVAKAMKQNALPTSVIALTTGLTENEIEQLQ